ncbi:hypothetical protein CVD28_23460 [Bacillus sp. M6-12]|uniref:hypothetical protein n=1 Tax=Bacillus sp. M6-12 TaxID=2054166 RepID=UPI000C75F00D|nr:hypothetical protein [Bacillus sp. M6-12]PLS15287.1 hypothetical protein CVD28_23460 [Bacillus sp. M6-12]
MKETQNTKQYLSHAPKEEVLTVQTGGNFPNLKHIPGDSVDGHEDQEIANSIIGGEEIRQQNDNL